MPDYIINRQEKRQNKNVDYSFILLKKEIVVFPEKL